MNTPENICYVPILRWKRAEWIALQNLPLDISDCILPLAEIVPTTFLTTKKESVSVNEEKKRVEKILNDIFNTWGDRPILIDLWLLKLELQIKILNTFEKNAQCYHLELIPVTGINKPEEFQSSIKSYGRVHNHGLCIRLFRGDIDQEISHKLNHLLKFFTHPPEKVDLIIDYQLLDDSNVIFYNIFHNIPFLSKWRTLTFASGEYSQKT
jgi:hypothetical protein